MDKSKIIQYLSAYLGNVSSKFLYIVFLLYYAYSNEKTPGWAKKIILGAIAYVFNPFDAVPDLTPFLGLTDDLGVIAFGLVSIACYIDKQVRQKARLDLISVLGSKTDIKIIGEVDSWL